MSTPLAQSVVKTLARKPVFSQYKEPQFSPLQGAEAGLGYKNNYYQKNPGQPSFTDVLREVPSATMSVGKSILSALSPIQVAQAAPLPKAKDKTDILARQIATLEGYKKTGTIADRQRNPGNLRYVGQKGATKGTKGFAVFPTHEAGWEALRSQITRDALRGKTLQQFIYGYAPPKENNTASYLRNVVKALGATPTSKLLQVLK